MNKENKILVLITFLFLPLVNLSLQGQFLKDTSSINLIKKGIDYVYNFDFNNADRVSAELRKSYPGHPVNFLFQGMITYWENYPLVTTSPARESFEADMRKSIELCDNNKDPSAEAEILLVRDFQE